LFYGPAGDSIRSDFTVPVDKFASAGIFVCCRTQIEGIEKSAIQQMAITSDSLPDGSREQTIRGFAKAMRRVRPRRLYPSMSASSTIPNQEATAGKVILKVA
jgi:hypothetical protein